MVCSPRRLRNFTWILSPVHYITLPWQISQCEGLWQTGLGMVRRAARREKRLGVNAPLYVRGEIRNTRTVPILGELAEAERMSAELPGAVDVVRGSRMSGFVPGCRTSAGCMRLLRTDLTGGGYTLG